MFLLQRITGEGVVEFFPSFLEPNQFEITPLMLHVAVLAFPKLRPAVDSLPFLDAGFEPRVTGQTFVRRDSPVGLMAGVAIFDPFQRGMALGQLSRGKLGVGLSEKKKKQHRSISASF
jgi:hypothetical protein